MIKIGQFNRLKVIKEVPFGVYLDGADWGEILLPKKFVPQGSALFDFVDVFVYFDSEDKVIATTQRPRALCDTCAYLEVLDVNHVGAFLDWGLDKDLLVPRALQHRPMEQGKSYLVYLKLDNQGRIIASSKLDHFLDQSWPHYRAGDEVSVLIAETTALGTKVIVNDRHWGLIHSADIFQVLRYGKRMPAYIKTVRADGKLDITLRKTGQDNINLLAERIIKMLSEQGGFLALHDKSPSDQIQLIFSESKKNFKSAIGQLYKKGLIMIEMEGIRLIKPALK